jgi:hypothetical protein
MLKLGLFVILSTIIFVQGCSDQCSSYSDFSCEEIDKATYNVLFYFPDNRKEYNLGVATGLDACGDLAHNYAASKGLSHNREWNYVCCMKAKGSECYEKHR